MDVDIVVAWVDGSDPKHRTKRALYDNISVSEGKPEAVATKTRRFSDNEEIRYCLRSLRNYAPWARNIWLVTDNQFPSCIDAQIAKEYGIRVVDHKEIFRGLEVLLPTFNSLSIETLLWRIEGLADHFLYLNDDMVLTGPVEKELFFPAEGTVTLRGGWADWSGKPKEEISFHGSNKVLGAELLGFGAERFFSPIHVIYPMWRPAMATLFEQFLPEFARNAAYRFRSRQQFWPMSAHNHYMIKAERAKLVDPDDAIHFSVNFCKRGLAEQLTKKLKRLSDPRIKMTCINYLEAITEKVPNAIDYLSDAAGPAAPFEVSAS